MVILGDTTVGKSSIINALNGNPINDKHHETVGTDFMNMIINKTKYYVWDTAGHDRYRSLSYIYIRDANILLIVFDIMNTNTIDVAIEYITKIEDTLLLGTYDIILICNKTDLIDNFDTNSESLKKNLFKKYPILEEYVMIFISAKNNNDILCLTNLITEKTNIIANNQSKYKKNKKYEIYDDLNNYNNSNTNCCKINYCALL